MSSLGHHWKLSDETKRKIGLANSIALKGRKPTKQFLEMAQNQVGENHWKWKGEKVSYCALHNWVKRWRGRPNHCENPNCVYPRLDAKKRLMIEPKMYCWANKDHSYKRNLDDYISLCQSCHKNYDIKYNGSGKGKKQPK